MVNRNIGRNVSEKHGFQTEAKQLLKLMTHSMYSNKEVFLRELISNGSDAIDKLRFAAVTNQKMLADDTELKITVDFDKDQKIVTIVDNGIGMTKEEVINNLGTIARSGTAEFVKAATSNNMKENTAQIGQFGVGFYSSFIVADKVEVTTRHAKSAPNYGVKWVSSGEDSYEISPVQNAPRGTTVRLFLREDCEEFLDAYRLRAIVRKYSDHISVPVWMGKIEEEKPEGESDASDEVASDQAEIKSAGPSGPGGLKPGGVGSKTPPLGSKGKQDAAKPQVTKKKEYEVINHAKALWLRPKNEITNEEYKQFYQHITHDFAEPLCWAHNKVEGKLDYTSLLYIPSVASFDIWNREAARGMKLYVQRVFIMDDAEQFLPLYLRFIKGIVDSSGSDISLNVSREILQDSPEVRSIRTALTKRALDTLEKFSKDRPEDYNNKFLKQFGDVLKEGLSEDFANREKIASLCRFSTSISKNEDEVHSLDDYISRAGASQKTIYYICAESFTKALNSPHLEVFKGKGIEVLLLHGRIDEWVMSQFFEYKDFKMQDVMRESLDLDESGNKNANQSDSDSSSNSKAQEGILKRFEEVLGDKVEKVLASSRLTDSPACLSIGQYDIGNQMRKIMESAGQQIPESKRILEINLTHQLIESMDQCADEDRFRMLVHLVFNQALLSEGGQLDDPASFVRDVNQLILETI